MGEAPRRGGLAPTTRWVKLTVSLDALNVARGPVDVKVWCDTALILDTRVGTVEPMTRYVPVRDGQTRMLVETWVSGSVSPPTTGSRTRASWGCASSGISSTRRRPGRMARPIEPRILANP